MKTTFEFKKGARISGVKADIVARELRRLQRGGRLQPEQIVEAARSEESPLHPVFEWDDGRAAQEYRLVQARQLIRAVVKVTDGKPRSVYVHVALSKDNGYEEIEAVVQQPDRFALALMELERRLRSAQEAVDELREAAEETGDADRLAVIAVAIKAFESATQAVLALH